MDGPAKGNGRVDSEAEIARRNLARICPRSHSSGRRQALDWFAGSYILVDLKLGPKGQLIENLSSLPLDRWPALVADFSLPNGRELAENRAGNGLPVA
jgi:hypothetical protein